ncbi:MAG: transglutaminase-like domain-containing protein [Bacteroidaceae bacterium]|nr:transglutaminase-like domain-containing protein [Bacteroidaceae bacterium]
MKIFCRLLLPILLFTSCLQPFERLDFKGYVDFLCDNLSLPDRTDYSRAYYAEQVRLALEARDSMPWGSTVPEREFRHFVLPPRVNNEDLDTCRAVFFRELCPRLQGMTMAQAILEVNHWCHEHVTYRPTSARTLSPLATMKTAYGRCGEESVFTVAALRSVGIPARQVYTPRWAHTDDNHAWVEAWADGQWHFLGACEPEPVLDMGWFNESASRGMLMHTRVFGDYQGPEEVVGREYSQTEINVTKNYAPTRKIIVEVLDEKGRPVSGADVEFKLYNYAEYYTVARKSTDSLGRARLTAGLGDMLVWATAPSATSSSSTRKGGVAFQQVSFATDSLVRLHLSPTLPDSLAQGLPIDVTPPKAKASAPIINTKLRAENNRQLALEDSIRRAYEATMHDSRSRGNYQTIKAFRDSAACLGKSEAAEDLITILPDKDLQDATLDVLLDNLPVGQTHYADSGTTEGIPADIRLPYQLSPRIERERLTAFKQPLRRAFKNYTVEKLIAWTRDNIQLVDDQNPRNLRMQPLGVYRNRVADALGRDIFFVAACRALDIPARIHEINGKVQYYGATDSIYYWHDVSFEPVKPRKNTAQPSSQQGTLRLTFVPTPRLPDVKYYTHFTLSQINEHQQPQLLTFPEEATFKNTFATGTPLDAGTYLLTTGVRMANGSVRSLLRTFTIAPDSITTLPLELREATDAVAVIGSLNAENLYQPLSLEEDSVFVSGSPTSLLATCGRGYYVLGLIAPNQEPTTHALLDLALVRDELKGWRRKIVLLFDDAEAARRFNFALFTSPTTADNKRLPSTVVWGHDLQGTIKAEIMEQLHLTSAAMPIFLICDSFNRVVFVQQGYTIGLGGQLLKVIDQL